MQASLGRRISEMGMEDAIGQILTAKDQKPMLFEIGPLEYDFHDIDGLYYMLDRKLSGCLQLMWTKPMDPNAEGTVLLDGVPVDGCVSQYMAVMGNMWVLGIPLRGRVTEYGKSYQLHIEGYADADGNVMEPQEFTVRGVEKTEPRPEYAAHEQTALQAAREGIVLLKNEGNILPLAKGSVLNLFGKGVHEFRIGAVGAGKINPRYSVNFLEAVRANRDYSLNEELVSFYGCDRDVLPPAEMMERAKEVSDTAVIFLTRAAGENQDASSAKGEYYLSDEEEELIRGVSEAFTNTIAVLNVGYPIDVTFAERYQVNGLVYPGFAGMLAGPALLDILSGNANPSGKLPDTWALDYFDIPSSKNFYDCADKPRLTSEDTVYIDTCYEEDIYVGYRYFKTFGKKEAYPFGFGLSYTEFEIRCGAFFFDGEALEAEAMIRNTGERAGKEVLQLYIGKPETDMEQPEKELVFFEKTKELAPGEAQRIAIHVPVKMLISFSEEEKAYILSAGEYRIYAGNSADAEPCGSFFVSEKRIIKKTEHLLKCGKRFPRLSRKDPGGTWPVGEFSGVVPGKTTFQPYQERCRYAVEKSLTERIQEQSSRIMFDDVRKDPKLAGAFAKQLTPAELARLTVCASAGWGMEGIGEAGRVFRLEGYGLPDFPVSDGNSGVNLNVKNIGMPSGAVLCASFNKALCEESGRVIGEEAKELGIPLILAPAFNIHRNPLNGRQPEYFSEDPYLSGVMAGYYARGMESTGTAGCYKHLIGNNCESSRKRNQSLISERAIREIYFRTYEYAMDIHMPASVMTAYNAVNGCPTAADEELIMGLLREENGFDGFVMTDWTTYDTVDVAAMVQAGNCWITPGSNDNTYTDQILKGLEEGRIDTARLRENVAALIRTMARFT